MPEPLRAGHLIDGFQVGECIHSGGTGFIYRVTAPPARDPGFPLVLKAPAVGRAQPTISIVSFEMEQMILPTLHGIHVPRFVAEGALTARGGNGSRHTRSRIPPYVLGSPNGNSPVASW